MLKYANRGALPAMVVLGVLIGASLALVSPSRPTRVVPSATMPVTVTPGVPGDDEAGGSAGAAEPHARPGKVENGGSDSSGTDASAGTASASSAAAGETGSGGPGGSGSGGSGGGGSASTGSGSTGGDGSASTGSDKSNNGKAKGHFDGKGKNG